MNPVNKALWYIESHFTQEITLDELAEASHVSRFHMSRAFATLVGLPMQRYLRGRRLTEAAKRLVEGNDGIATIAFDHGYGSHEAFTRAFRDQFGVTPEAVRARGHLRDLPLVKPISLELDMTTEPLTPKIHDHSALLIAGSNERYNCSERAGIPSQWQRFSPYLGNVPSQVGQDAYGVCYNTDDEANLDYMCGVEVKDFSGVPAELTRLRIPPQRYAVFQHRDHISMIDQTLQAIFSKWLPESEYEIVDAPLLERYPPTFNGMTGMGGMEIWVPVAEKRAKSA